MPAFERQQVYVPDKLVSEAREKGMTNLSGFVREKLKEYIEAGVESTAKQNTPTTTPEGAAHEI